MQIELALRLSEALLGLAMLVQSLEFFRSGLFTKISLVRATLSGSLIACSFFTINPVLPETILIASSLYLVWRFRGPYNGGSDTMTLLVLFSLWLARLAPNHYWQEMALGYLALQLVWCYFQSGWVKVTNPHWRSGQALQQVFAISAYPVSQHTRRWAQQPKLLWLMGWLVILLELVFPLALLNKTALLIALALTFSFHLANAWVFGLNRFFWIWPAAYPAVIWLQGRLVVIN